MTSRDSVTKFHFNKFIEENKGRFLSKKKISSPPRSKPPPPPSSTNHCDDFVSVPSPSLHNLPIHALNDQSSNNTLNSPNPHSDVHDPSVTLKQVGSAQHDSPQSGRSTYSPTSLAKKRLMLELERFFFVQPPSPHKPTVSFTSNRKKFVLDLESRLSRFGGINASSGSGLVDLQSSLHSGMNWVVSSGMDWWSKNGFKMKKPMNREMDAIPPPLLVVYLNAVEKALAEEFAECLTAVTMDVGVIISVSDYNDDAATRKWLDPQSINATKIGMKRAVKERTSDGMVYHNRALNEVAPSPKVCGWKCI